MTGVSALHAAWEAIKSRCQPVSTYAPPAPIDHKT